MAEPKEELDQIEKRLDELWDITMAPLIRIAQCKSADPYADLEEFVNGHKEENEEEDRLIARRAFIKEHTNG